jgi:hypothetical protein
MNTLKKIALPPTTKGKKERKCRVVLTKGKKVRKYSLTAHAPTKLPHIKSFRILFLNVNTTPI